MERWGIRNWDDESTIGLKMMTPRLSWRRWNWGKGNMSDCKEKRIFKLNWTSHFDNPIQNLKISLLKSFLIDQSMSIILWPLYKRVLSDTVHSHWLFITHLSFTPNPLHTKSKSHNIHPILPLQATPHDLRCGDRGESDKDKNNNSANDADISRPNLKCSIEYTYLQVYIIVID